MSSNLASVVSVDGATHVRAMFAPRLPETLGCPKPGGIGLVGSSTRPTTAAKSPVRGLAVLSETRGR